MTCKTHKTYRGIRKPTANCRKCKFIFTLRHVLKACGFTVAEKKPRGQPFLFVDKPKPPYATVEKLENDLGVAVLAPTKAAGLTNAEADAKDAVTFQIAAAGLEADPEFPGVAFGAGPSLRYNATPEQVRNIGEGAKAE